MDTDEAPQEQAQTHAEVYVDACISFGQCCEVSRVGAIEKGLSALKAKVYWPQACAHLSQQDSVMARLITTHEPVPFATRSSAFIVLCRAVTGQQISVKAAKTIWNRLTAMCDPFQPQILKRCRNEYLYRCGLSKNKARYLKNIADFFIANRVDARYWRQDHEEVRDSLLAVPGIGQWTFEMFAIFYLNHPDILPLGDMGLVNAVSRLYRKGENLDRHTVATIGERWAPWRTVATWYLWRSIDADIVVY